MVATRATEALTVESFALIPRYVVPQNICSNNRVGRTHPRASFRRRPGRLPTSLIALDIGHERVTAFVLEVKRQCLCQAAGMPSKDRLVRLTPFGPWSSCRDPDLRRILAHAHVGARQSLQNLSDSRVPQFVPLFVGRFTRERLQQLTGFRPRGGFIHLTRSG